MNLPVSLDTDFWDDLLEFIADGRVIPIIGPGAVTFGENDRLLYPWLAARLADSLALPTGILPPEPSLNEVVAAHRLAGGAANKPYLRLKRLVEDPTLTPGPSLRRIASIAAFRLYLTGAFDPLLVAALNLERHGGEPRTVVQAYSSRDPCDLPARMRNLNGSHVFHLLGRVSSSPEYVVWDEDAMEFALALQRHLPVMERLARDLQEASFLVLGLDFTDWLVRFLLRITKQARLSEIRSHEVLAGCLPRVSATAANSPGTQGRPGQILFFGNPCADIHLIPATPSDFIAELARRWHERFPGQLPGASSAALVSVPMPEMPRGAIFLSYAREDEAAVIALKALLEPAGCVVWYDRERLRPGANWENDLSDEVTRSCCAFVSLISRTTESQGEAYFHKERYWAAQRAPMFASGEPFYFPVVIDDTALPARREPAIFREVHAVFAAGGRVESNFITALLAVQRQRAPHLVSASP